MCLPQREWPHDQFVPGSVGTSGLRWGLHFAGVPTGASSSGCRARRGDAAMVRAWHGHVLNWRMCGPSWGEPEIRDTGGGRIRCVGAHGGVLGVCRLRETEAPERGRHLSGCTGSVARAGRDA
jgi:hypothetical protein